MNEASQSVKNRSDLNSEVESNFYEYGNPALVATERDWNLVMEMIENPPEPSPILFKAVERYNRYVESKSDTKKVDN